MAFFGISETTVVGFVMVLARITGVFLIAPIFGSRAAPPQIRIGIALVLALVLSPLAGIERPQPTDIAALVGGILGEAVLGLGMGFVVYMVFAAAQAAGHAIDLMIGFALANVIDPLSNVQGSIIGQFYHVVTVLAFFAVDGHHLLVRGLAESFQMVPIGEAAPSIASGDLLIRSFSDVFLIAVQIALPILAALLVTDFFLAVMSRAMPRMNVFFVGFPLRIGVGLIFIGLSMSFVVPFLASTFTGGIEDMGRLISAFGRG